MCIISITLRDSTNAKRDWILSYSSTRKLTVRVYYMNTWYVNNNLTYIVTVKTNNVNNSCPRLGSHQCGGECLAVVSRGFVCLYRVSLLLGRRNVFEPVGYGRRASKADGQLWKLSSSLYQATTVKERTEHLILSFIVHSTLLYSHN